MYRFRANITQRSESERIDVQYLLYEQSGIQYIYHEFNIYPNETFFNFITNMRMSMTAVA